MGKEVTVGNGTDDSFLHFNEWLKVCRISICPDNIAIIQKRADVCVVHGFENERWHETTDAVEE